MDVIGEVKPTVMCAVPRLYEKAYAMIQAKVAQAPRLRRALFGWATRVGKQMVATRQAGKSASPALWPALACRAPGVSQAARPFRRSHPLPAGGGRPSRGRGESSSRPWGSTSSTATA
jgi:long-chain acyl-CoA synthetase